MENREIRELSNIEIVKMIKDEALSLQKTKINHAVSELETPRDIVVSRKLIARLKTEERKRQLKK